MGKAIVIASFTICVFFNVFLNSFDVYSDTALAYKTLTFNLGDSLLLSGCRVCHDKDDKDVFTSTNRSCHQCLTVNKDFQCGNNFEILDKIHELQQVDTCNDERFNLKWTLKRKPLEAEFHIDESRICDSLKHFCCVENTMNTTEKGPLDHLDKRIVAFNTNLVPKINSFIGYDTYVLSGQKSSWYCQKLIANEYDILEKYLSSLIQLDKTKSSTRNKSELNVKFVKNSDGKLIIKDGFSFNEDCGMLITGDIDASNNGEKTCESDSCLVHLQSLKYNFNISSVRDWSKATFFEYGRKLGGKTCQLLRIYGIAYLVPIVVTLTFNLLVYLEEIKNGTASKIEVVFVILQFYPQWKTICFLWEYIYYQNEVQFTNSRKNFDATLGGLEPYLEAAFQVGHSYFIALPENNV